MRLPTALAMLAGLALLVALVAGEGVRAVWHSAERLGAGGFAAIVAFHLLLIVQMGSAWWFLSTVPAIRAERARSGRPPLRLAVFAWGRLIRDSAAEALPLSQIGGFVLGARALVLAGAAPSFSAGSTVVDVTVELVAQLAYTALGLALLQWLRPGSGLGAPILAGLALMICGVGGFVTLQARGAGLVERTIFRLAPRFLGGASAHDPAVQRTIRALHRGPGTLLSACSIHLVSWLLSGVETWLTLRMMAVPVSLPGAVAIDALLYGMRSAAFFVPNAVGVQEGGLILLCGLFGIGADTALALSLIKRARDLGIGIPALLGWQAAEGRRALRLRAQVASSLLPPDG